MAEELGDLGLLVVCAVAALLMIPKLRRAVGGWVRSHINSLHRLPNLHDLPAVPGVVGNPHAELAGSAPSEVARLLHEQEGTLGVQPGSEKRITLPSSHALASHGHSHSSYRDSAPSPIPAIPTPKPELCVVYIHGWSACRQDCSPVPQALAEALECPLFCTRLSGHGFPQGGHGDGSALLTHATPERLLADAEEAMHVGKQLANRVILMGFSTGGALVTWLAAQPRHKPFVAGLVLKSPCFAFRHPIYPALKWVRAVLRCTPQLVREAATRLMCAGLLGKHVVVDIPRENKLGTRFWTMKYPAASLMHVVDVLWQLDTIDFRQIDMPTLVIANPQDDKVSYDEIVKRFDEMGASTKVLMNIRSVDPHVVCGHILAPATTDQCIAAVRNFATLHIHPVPKVLV